MYKHNFGCVNNTDPISIQTTSFESPHYIPVSQRDFDTMQINMRDETGRKVPFQFGWVVVKLPFRLRRQSLFASKMSSNMFEQHYASQIIRGGGNVFKGIIIKGTIDWDVFSMDMVLVAYLRVPYVQHHHLSQKQWRYWKKKYCVGLLGDIASRKNQKIKNLEGILYEKVSKKLSVQWLIELFLHP